MSEDAEHFECFRDAAMRAYEFSEQGKGWRATYLITDMWAREHGVDSTDSGAVWRKFMEVERGNTQETQAREVSSATR